MTARSLDAWLAYLERLHPVAIDMGLDRVRLVAERLGASRPAPRVVTVTGTNGKGSTCSFLAALLTSQGLKVGVYSSPHLLRYNERVVIDGQPVSDDALCQAFEAVERARGEVSLTYFEMGTLAAFWLFERAALDVAVLEVGLGGRLDAVNLIDADVAVVTNIGLDHAEWLGDTRESVAREKAGIFRPGRPAICGDRMPPATLVEAACEVGATLLQRGADFDCCVSQDTWHWHGLDAQGAAVELAGLRLPSLPVENAALALQAFFSLGFDIGAIPANAALSAARMTGRLDRRVVTWRGKRLQVLLDVGHNPHAAEFLARELTRRPVSGRRLGVFGLLADKDLSGILDALLGHVDAWAVAPLPTPRTRSSEQLQQALAQRGALVEACGSIGQALEQQCEQATEDDELLVFGSFYCVAEGLDWMQRLT
ncbi:bifunctional tetrahydrofolate synthase/dihydrofolate synthase [Stutzerimonas urumqiensis]|uniref:bifunctional tetrahydrofolate synthase/dihydrofolate synthase n=1 Tax=Stutzerimonas urumqiensis TaxID=638269 RepID=UPI003DA2F8AE